MPHLSPQTLTHDEVQALLTASAGHPRDHLVFSLALGTALRLSELVGMNVGDLYFPTGQPRLRVRVRADIAKRGRVGDVFLPDALGPKLQRFWSYKLEHGERVQPLAPLFCGQSRRRLSPRRLQVLFRTWQRIAGFDRLYPLHGLRHYAALRIMPSHFRADEVLSGLTWVLTVEDQHKTKVSSTWSKSQEGRRHEKRVVSVRLSAAGVVSRWPVELLPR